MKVKDLQKKLAQFSPNAEVVIGCLYDDGRIQHEQESFAVHKNNDLCIEDSCSQPEIIKKDILRKKLIELTSELKNAMDEANRANSDEERRIILLFTPRHDLPFLEKDILSIKERIKEIKQTLSKKIVVLF